MRWRLPRRDCSAGAVPVHGRRRLLGFVYVYAIAPSSCTAATLVGKKCDGKEFHVPSSCPHKRSHNSQGTRTAPQPQPRWSVGNLRDSDRPTTVGCAPPRPHPCGARCDHRPQAHPPSLLPSPQISVRPRAATRVGSAGSRRARPRAPAAPATRRPARPPYSTKLAAPSSEDEKSVNG